MTNFLRFGLLFSAFVATPALAEPSATVENRIVVATADLDLSNATGQRMLDRRLAIAVDQACGAASVVDLAGQNDVRRCRVETSARIAADRDRLVQVASKGGSIVLAAR